MDFSRRWILRFATLAAGIIPFAGTLLRLRTSTSAHAQDRKATPPLLARVDELADRVTSGDGQSIPGLVDAALTCSVFSTSCQSIRNRITRAELAFRDGGLSPITERRLLSATNGIIGAAAVSLRFDATELQQWYTRLKAATPHLFNALQGLSPLAAVFLIGFILQQKLSGITEVPDYISRPLPMEKRHANYTTEIFIPVSPHGPSTEITALTIYLYEGLAQEQGPATAMTHIFLDQIGVPR